MSMKVINYNLRSDAGAELAIAGQRTSWQARIFNLCTEASVKNLDAG